MGIKDTVKNLKEYSTMTTGDTTNELVFGGGKLPEKAQFALRYSPARIGDVMPKVKHVKDVLALSADINPTLGSLVRNNGGDYAEAFIEMWLEDLSDFINVKSPMTTHQKNSTAKLILESYGMLTVADLKVLFAGVKKGEYADRDGKTLYHALDGMTVLSWFKRYLDDRCNIAAEISENDHKAVMEQSGEISDVGKKYLKEIADRLREKANKRRELEQPKQRTKTPAEIVVEIALDIKNGIVRTADDIQRMHGLSKPVAEMCFLHFDGYPGVQGIIEARCNPKDKEFKLLMKRVIADLNNGGSDE